MATLAPLAPVLVTDDSITAGKAVPIPGTSMRCKVMTITPEIAESLLAKNTSNRPLDKDKVRAWLKEMQAHRWKLTHQGIAFASDGTLVDGQHRLHAIIENGETVEMLVFLDCDKESFDVLDVGKKRTHNDILRLGGISASHKIAKLARLYGLTSDPREWDKGTVTPAELYEWAQPHSDALVTAAALQKKVVKARRVLAMEAGAAMAIYQIHGGISAETVFELFYQPMIEFHSDQSNPAWIFYQYVIRSEDERKKAAGPFWGSDRRDLSLPRARLWMQLAAIRDVLEGSPRNTYTWNPAMTMPDVLNLRSNTTAA